MELYTNTSFELVETLTKRYSTSFSKSSRLFDISIRKYIFAIYGMVRIADEIVDTLKNDDSAALLGEFEQQVYTAIDGSFTANPVLQAFGDTVRRYNIDRALIEAFFASMKMDLTKKSYSQDEYERYIYGSAEVIGLMCLAVFINNSKRYSSLSAGARTLGAAYQKVNFLRDIADDFTQRGRVYFPDIIYETFSDAQKHMIIADCEKDFREARNAIEQLPASSRRAVRLSYLYYHALLMKLNKATTQEITTERIHVSMPQKLLLYSRSMFPLGKTA